MENNTSRSKSKSNKSRALFVKGGYFDYQCVFLVLVLVMFGLMMVYSASSYRAVMNGLDSAYYFRRQLIFAVVGFVAMIAASKINYKSYAKLSIYFMVIALFLCVFVLFGGVSSHGASRWINLGFFSFQPSEIAKPIIAIYMAYVCTVHSNALRDLRSTLILLILPSLCILAIMKENLSTAIVCAIIVFAVLFVASPKPQYIIGMAVVFGIIAYFAIFKVGYRSDRIDAWFHPETSESGFQTMQSMYAIGSGGLFGRGLGESIQKMGFLPESHNDMIFSIICEELGLVGAFGVIALFVMLLMTFKRIANNCEDSFAGLLMTGIIAHIATQTLINIGVVTNAIPPTGVTLPFISYGGTSLIFLMVEMGLVLGVSRQTKPLNVTR